jgi:hypothetical protein
MLNTLRLLSTIQLPVLPAFWSSEHVPIKFKEKRSLEQTGIHIVRIELCLVIKEHGKTQGFNCPIPGLNVFAEMS